MKVLRISRKFLDEVLLLLPLYYFFLLLSPMAYLELLFGQMKLVNVIAREGKMGYLKKYLRKG